MINDNKANYQSHEQYPSNQARPYLTRCLSDDSLYIHTHPKQETDSEDLAALGGPEFESTDLDHPFLPLQSSGANGVQDSFSSENSLQSPEGIHDTTHPAVYSSELYSENCEGLEFLDFNYSADFITPCVQEALSVPDIPLQNVQIEGSYNINDNGADFNLHHIDNQNIDNQNIDNQNINNQNINNQNIDHINGHVFDYNGNYNASGTLNISNANNIGVHNSTTSNHSNQEWAPTFNVDELNETELNELTGDLVDMFSDEVLMSSPPATVNGDPYGNPVTYQMDNEDQAPLMPVPAPSYGHSAMPPPAMGANVYNGAAPFHHAYAYQSMPRHNPEPQVTRPEHSDLDFEGLGIFLSPNTSPDDDSAIQVRKNEALVPPSLPLHMRLHYPDHFMSDDNIDESTQARQGSHNMIRNPRDMLLNDHSLKSQSISKMPLAHMYAMMGLSSDHVKAKWREERIINIVRAEGFKVGSQTWIRDTEESERFRIINSILFQCGREFGYDKTLIEVVVRRGTYARMQSKLRQERRIKRRVIASQKPAYPPVMHYRQSER